MEESPEGFIDFFRTIPYHRIERKKLYPVEELLRATFCGVIAGCDGWDDLELFGETKLTYLQRYLPFKHGAPSDDTLRRFFQALDPARFEACFLEWIKSFQLDLTTQVVADVRLLFEEKPAAMAFAVSEETDKGHGRSVRQGDQDGVKGLYPSTPSIA